MEPQYTLKYYGPGEHKFVGVMIYVSPTVASTKDYRHQMQEWLLATMGARDLRWSMVGLRSFIFRSASDAMLFKLRWQ